MYQYKINDPDKSFNMYNIFISTRTQSQITESTDSCCPDLHNTVRVFNETMVYNEVSMSISENRIEKWRVIKSDKQTENRIGYDGPGDVPYHVSLLFLIISYVIISQQSQIHNLSLDTLITSIVHSSIRHCCCCTKIF